MSVQNSTLLELEQAGRWEEMPAVLGAHYPEPQEEDAETLYWCGVTLGRLGRAHRIDGAQIRARQLFTGAMDLPLADDSAASCLSRIGITYWREGQLSEAERHLEEALQLARNPDSESIILINTSIVLKDQGKFYEAIKVCNEAQALAVTPYTSGLWCLEAGRVNRYLEDYRQGLEYTGMALEYFSKVGHKPYTALAHNNLADLYTLTRQFYNSARHLDQAALIALQLNDKPLSDLVSESRGELISASLMQEATR